MHQYDGTWIAFFSKWNIPERPWVPAFFYVMMQQLTDAGLKNEYLLALLTLTADVLIKMVSV